MMRLCQLSVSLSLLIIMQSYNRLFLQWVMLCFRKAGKDHMILKTHETKGLYLHNVFTKGFIRHHVTIQTTT